MRKTLASSLRAAIQLSDDLLAIMFGTNSKSCGFPELLPALPSYLKAQAFNELDLRSTSRLQRR
jgi:hypothetical protein